MIYQNNHIYIEVEKSEIPWLKIFSQKPYKEFSECDRETREQILVAWDVIEKAMIEFYSPTKINIASFGNYLPKVHFHVMARFESDSYFPEPMWGKKQRDGSYKLENFEEFLEIVKEKLTNILL